MLSHDKRPLVEDTLHQCIPETSMPLVGAFGCHAGSVGGDERHMARPKESMKQGLFPGVRSAIPDAMMPLQGVTVPEYPQQMS